MLTLMLTKFKMMLELAVGQLMGLLMGLHCRNNSASAASFSDIPDTFRRTRFMRFEAAHSRDVGTSRDGQFWGGYINILFLTGPTGGCTLRGGGTLSGGGYIKWGGGVH